MRVYWENPWREGGLGKAWHPGRGRGPGWREQGPGAAENEPGKGESGNVGVAELDKALNGRQSL